MFVRTLSRKTLSALLVVALLAGGRALASDRDDLGAILELNDDDDVTFSPERIVASCFEVLTKKEKLPSQDLAKILVLRGNGYIRLREFKKALADYDDALRLRPNDAIIHVKRIEALLGLSSLEQAEAEAKQLIKDNPKCAKAYRALAFATQQKDKARCIEYATKAISLDPYDSLSYVVRAAAHLALEEYPEALGDCNQCIINSSSESVPKGWSCV